MYGLKTLLLLCVLLLVCLPSPAQNQGNDAAAIRKRMAAIRLSTNWDDPAAAKKANDTIKVLAAKLTQAIRQGNSNAGTGQKIPGGITAEEASQVQKNIDDYNNKLTDKIISSASASAGGKLDFAQPLREEIVEEYKEDGNRAIKCPDWFQQIPYLLINVSMPGVQAVIDQMELFRGIRILVVTCEKPGTPVNLQEILKKAANYPLEELYVMNFGPAVTSIPSEVNGFKQLKTLAWVNNKLNTLPAFVGGMGSLNSIQVDMNPVATVINQVRNLKSLKQIGLAKTGVSASEVNQLKQLLPDCQISIQ